MFEKRFAHLLKEKLKAHRALAVAHGYVQAVAGKIEAEVLSCHQNVASLNAKKKAAETAIENELDAIVYLTAHRDEQIAKAGEVQKVLGN